MERRPVTIPLLIRVVYLPMLLTQAGLGMGLPFIPLYTKSLGGTLALAGLIPSLEFLGMALMDLPGGVLISRWGERRLIVLGGTGMVAALAVRALVPSLTALAVSSLLFGAFYSPWWLGRSTWMKEAIPGRIRGRAMSLLGGVLRVSRIIGPLAGGFMAENLGYRSLYLTQSALTGAALLLVISGLPRITGTPLPYREALSVARERLRERRGTVLAAMLGIGGLSLLRAARSILIPLWGDHLGLTESRIGAAVSVGSSADTAFFWSSGVIMDRKGRRWSAILSTSGLTLGLALIPLAGGWWGLAAAAAVAGLGNAMGAGINMTVSADLAPRRAAGVFLSFWRFSQGLAAAAGPALAGVTAQALGTGAAPLAVAAAGVASAVVMGRWLGETGPRDEALPSQ